VKYTLPITSLIETREKFRGLVKYLTVDVDLGQYSEFEHPDAFVGKLVDATLEKILELKFSPGVEATFRGSVYKFEELEKDGTFKLRKG
jgi:hypothetical protein